MVEGDGQIYVNGIPMMDAFPDIVGREAIVRPFEATGTLGKYNVWALVQYSGPSSQAGAVAVAVARGIAVHNPHVKEHLRQCKLMTLADLETATELYLITRVWTVGMSVIDTRQAERIKVNKLKARKSRTWYVFCCDSWRCDPGD